MRAPTLSGLDEPWRGRLSGTARYVAKVSLGEGRARFTVDSPLVGVASTLPPPLAKAAAASLPLHLEIAPGGDGRERISLTLGRLAAAEVLRRRQGAQMVVQRAAVWVSPVPGQPVRLPERPGTLVYGTIPSLDLDRWLALARAGRRAAAPARRSTFASARSMPSASASRRWRCAPAPTPWAGRRR